MKAENETREEYIDRVINLSPDEVVKFMEEMKYPAPVKDKLIDAFRRYQESLEEERLTIKE